MISSEDDLLQYYAKAMLNGDAEDIAKAIDKARSEASFARKVITDLLLKHPERTIEHCKSITELPSVYSVDKSKNAINEEIAHLAKLGENSKFNYKDNRKTDSQPIMAVEVYVEIIEKLRCSCAELPEHTSLEIREVISKIRNLPDLTLTTIAAWKEIIAEHAICHYLAAEQKTKQGELISPNAQTLAANDLIKKARSYAEQRLQSRKAERLKNLHKKFTEGEKLNKMDKNGEELHGSEAVYLTKYQSKLVEIQGMQLDRACWKHGLRRLVGEKLKRLLRSK